jgi:cell division transport system permease protein
VTRTGLSIHRSVIEIVHLIGAPDSYIAQQFQAQSLRLGIVGGVVGTILAAATLLGADHLLHVTSSLAADGNAALGGDPSGLALNLDVKLLPWQWGVFALLPFATALIAMITARWTVLRSLARFI